jgi:hypothetical protein
MKNPLQQREVKTTDTSQQNFTISGVFTNTVDYFMMRLTLAGGLQGEYIGGPSLRQWASLRSSEVSLYFVEFKSTYNMYNQTHFFTFHRNFHLTYLRLYMQITLRWKQVMIRPFHTCNRLEKQRIYKFWSRFISQS